MGQPRWLRWLHRIGYVTTAMVLLGGLFGGLFLALSVVGRPSSPLITDQDATYEGKLEDAWRKWGEYGGRSVLASLPDRDSLNRSGLRLVIMPSFSDWFGLAIHPGRGGEAVGVLTRHQQPPWNPEEPLPPIEIGRVAFDIPAQEFSQFLNWFDDWAAQHQDVAYAPCLDGTPTVFERVRGAQVTSGQGNCERHYDELKQRALALVKRNNPDTALAVHPDWHAIER